MSGIIHKKAYAKLNLYLDITGLAENNYHTIETVMQSIDLCDDICISIRENGSNIIKIRCDDPDIPTDGRNIAYKAADEFLWQLRSEKRYDVNIDIKKRIPVEGGLGGSSADGATVLTALNEWFGFPVSTEELCKIGSGLGADLPFCITSGTCVCKGTGEIITRIKPIGDCYFVIIKPGFSFSSGDGYRLYDKNPIPIKGDFKKFTEHIKRGSFIGGAGLMYNAFEYVYNDERIFKFKKRLLKSGAQGAMMTGSGSAVFGVYDNKDKAMEAFQLLSKKGGETVIFAKPVNYEAYT